MVCENVKLPLVKMTQQLKKLLVAPKRKNKFGARPFRQTACLPLFAVSLLSPVVVTATGKENFGTEKVFRSILHPFLDTSSLTRTENLILGLLLKSFLFVIYFHLFVTYGCNLLNLSILCRNLRSKFGRNHKSIIYRYVKLQGICLSGLSGPSSKTFPSNFLKLWDYHFGKKSRCSLRLLLWNKLIVHFTKYQNLPDLLLLTSIAQYEGINLVNPHCT